ncbi:Putative secreted phospholipase [Corynebacterium glyciniphilum AJ 3170]|uniref:Putative secreted phospholipase n=1 Tax=Corynebacterium glyciniphilum AJ 3170 TaxID=1404245 RepID=X5DKC0_9CORY|nr:SGNH/GDSL hydrolase family protein [Corynebacterium glyciniphilum]AHW63558.1 Putative secreted phospholipase [Corynebacterium glyciniphilum AJ 3170]
MKKSITSGAVALFTSMMLVGCSGQDSNGAGPDASDTESGSAVEQASGINEGVFFGDSLTDAGTYGFRWTTMPGESWAQMVAEEFGQSTDSNEHVANVDDVHQGIPGNPGPGGLNYAEGGARADEPYSAVSDNPDGTPIAATVQLQRYLDQHDSFRSDQFISLFIGTNDVALNFDPSQNEEIAEGLSNDERLPDDVAEAERSRIESAAESAGETVQKILDNGAEHVLVFNLYDLADAPWSDNGATQDFMGEMTDVYNEKLESSLPDDPRVDLFDLYALMSDIVAAPEDYGFTHGANEDACAPADVEWCDEGEWKSPTADRDYVFAGRVHLTTRTNEIIADRVLEKVNEDMQG